MVMGGQRFTEMVTPGAKGWGFAPEATVLSWAGCKKGVFCTRAVPWAEKASGCLPAVGADALDDVVGGLCLPAVGEGDGRDGDVAQAEGLAAALAVEVDVDVAVVVLVVAQA